MNAILSFDPGLSGGLAILGKGGLKTFSMPTKKLKNGKLEIDPCALTTLISPLRFRVGIAAIEKVHSMPGQGVVSTFNFGMGYGMVIGVLAALEIKTVRISPVAWKASLGLSRNKRESIALAKELFPQNIDDFKRLKDDGKAEAALIAHFIKKSFGL